MASPWEYLVDVCAEWLGRRNCAYLAKEDLVVYYTSHTGHESDYLWMSMTLAEVVRVIQVTKLTDQDILQKSHVVTALQEQARVYEFGMKSRSLVAPHIFNYMSESKKDMGDMIASSVCTEVMQRGYIAVRYSAISEIISQVNHKLGMSMSLKDKSRLIHKHFPNAGYEVRVDKYRPQIDGRKQSCIMMPGTKPKSVVGLSDAEISEIATKVYSLVR